MLLVSLIKRMHMSMNAETRGYHSYVRTVLGEFQHITRSPDGFEKECVSTTSAYPPTNIIETDRHFEITLALPGYERSELKIAVNEDILNVTAEPSITINSVQRIIQEEFCPAKFDCNFLLPENIRTDKMVYDYHRGILKIRIRKN
ncbi:MAG: Hsp20/alpha crystallin family protein [Sphingobacteriales bacterium]|nr:MAG: Hsp20/alpha crystallin family protein [Sphingobacteriales bacterium]